MKNRTDEYWELIGELSQPPQKLEGTVERARKRAHRAGFLRRLATPAATFAAAAACFVLMVNAFPTFALACSGVPILRELTAAVAFSPSLSAAVAHDYVQYIGQSQTVDGVTVNLEYAIVDNAQAVFFYSVDGGRFYTSPMLTGENGTPISGYGLSTSGYFVRSEADSLEHMVLDFTDGCGLPNRFTMEMFIMPEPEPLPDQMTVAWEEAPATAAPEASVDDYDPDLWRNPREDPGVLSFTFDVALSQDRISEPTTVPVDRWMELDGQRILVDRLEYYPTRTILYLGEDPENTAWLRTIQFWFKDEDGTRYDNIDGSISAIGEDNIDSKSFLTYYFQSFYYNEPKGLTLCIDKAEWLEKDRAHVFLDLTARTCPGLPEGVEVGEVTHTGDSVKVRFFAPMERQGLGQTFRGNYWDPEGREHSFTRWVFTNRYDDSGNQTGYCEDIYLEDYPWDTVELELSYTTVSKYEQPVCVPLAPPTTET